MREQFKVNLKFQNSTSNIRSIISLYLLTLGSSVLGMSAYLLLEVLNITSRTIINNQIQGFVYLLVCFLISLFILFLPFEFFYSFKVNLNNFRDLVLFIFYSILVSLTFFIFFQIIIPQENQVLLELLRVTRAISFSGFIVIPIFTFILSNLKPKFKFIDLYTYHLIFITWLLSVQLFL